MRLHLFIITFVVVQGVSAQCNDLFHGEATFYGYSGGGNCSYADPELPAMTGAINQQQYDSSEFCGVCAEVTGPEGSLIIRIEDRCPECAFGDIDMSEDAFPLVAKREDGRVPISWKIVPCPVEGPIQFYFKEGSSQWWTAVQIRNHKYPVKTVELYSEGRWEPLPRTMYNYFMKESGFGTGPYDFRIISIYGDTLLEKDIPFAATTIIDGTQQFSDCLAQTNADRQVLPLKQGWNIISLYVKADDMTVCALLPNASVVKTFDAFFMLEADSFINSINQLSTQTAYLVYNTIEEQVVIEGKEDTVYKIQSIQKGWNLFAYPFRSETVIDSSLQAVRGNLVYLKTFERSWSPDSAFNSLKVFVPGYGYFLYAKKNTQIDWKSVKP